MYKHSTVHERSRPLGYDESQNDLVTSESDPDTLVNLFTIGSNRERVNSFRWDEESRDLGRRSKSLDFSAQHSRKRKRVDFSPSENSDEHVKDSHDDSEIPFADIIQGVSDSLNLPLTSTAIKPSKKPSACLGYRHPETGYRKLQYDYPVPTSGKRRPATVNRESVIDDWDRQLYKHSTVHERSRPLGYDGSQNDLVTSESDPDTLVNLFTICSNRERVNSFRWDEESRDLGCRSKSLDFSAQHSRKRKRVDFSPSENSDEHVKDSHDDSEIPFPDIIQGVSDSLNLPLTSTAIRPSKKPSACLGSDGENTENKALPLSPWLAAIWKDLDNDLKGSNPSGMPMEKKKISRDILRAKGWLLKTTLFR